LVERLAPLLPEPLVLQAKGSVVRASCPNGFWVEKDLALLVNQSVSLGPALELSATAVRDRSLSDACKSAATRAASGMPISRCVARENVFPYSLMPFLEWGDRTASLGDALLAAAEWFRRRCELNCNLLTVVAPPLVLLLVMAVTMYVLTAFVSPLFEAISALI